MVGHVEGCLAKTKVQEHENLKGRRIRGEKKQKEKVGKYKTNLSQEHWVLQSQNAKIRKTDNLSQFLRKLRITRRN